MDVLVFAATREEAQSVRPMDPPLLVTGPGPEQSAVAVTAQLASMQPWDRPRLAVHIGIAQQIDPNLSLSVHTPRLVEKLDDRSASLAVQGSEPLTLVSAEAFVDEHSAKELAQAGVAMIDREGYAFAAACAHVNVSCAIARYPFQGHDADAWDRNVDGGAVALAEFVRALGSRLR